MNRVEELLDAFLNIKSRSEMLDFLKGILTPTELDQLSTRLQIIKMLKNGMNQENIAKSLNVGIATVTRGSRELKMGRFKTV